MFGRKRDRLPLPDEVTSDMVEIMLSHLYPDHDGFDRIGLTTDKGDWRARIRRGLKTVLSSSPDASRRAAATREAAKCLEWALDLLDIYDEGAIKDGHSEIVVLTAEHIEAKLRARTVLARFQPIREEPPPSVTGLGGEG